MRLDMPDEPRFPAPPDHPEICAALETYLERGRRGEIRSLGIAVIYSDGSWHGESVADRTDKLQLAGALETVILRLPSDDLGE